METKCTCVIIAATGRRGRCTNMATALRGAAPVCDEHVQPPEPKKGKK